MKISEFKGDMPVMAKLVKDMVRPGLHRDHSFITWLKKAFIGPNTVKPAAAACVIYVVVKLP